MNSDRLQETNQADDALAGVLADRLGYRMREAHDSFTNSRHAMRTQTIVENVEKDIDTVGAQLSLLEKMAMPSDFGLINSANKVSVLGSLRQSCRLRYSLTRREALCRMAGRSRALAPAVRYLHLPWDRIPAQPVQ